MKNVHLTVFITLCFAQISLAQWTILPSGTENDLVAIDFVDAMHGVAVGNNATVLITTDGGNSWTPANTEGIKEDLRSVQILHPDTIIVGGGTIFESQLYRSVDGGQSWEPLIKAAEVAETQSRLSAFNYENVYYSDDRGNEWDTTALDLGSTVLMENLYFLPQSDTGYLSGNVSGFATYSAFAFRSVDGGLNWAPFWVFDLPNNNAAMSFTAPDADTAYLFANEFVNYLPGPKNQLVRLTDFYFDAADERNSWRFTAEIIQEEMPAQFISSYFSNAQTGFAGSREGEIYRTVDGGVNWELDFEADSSIYEIIGLGEETFYAVGANGVILKNDLNTGTNDQPKVLTAALYPNPTQSALFLKDVPVHEGLMRLYSINGQLLKTTDWIAGDPIVVSDLPAGLYLLEIRSGTENYLAKFQKQ